jgi:hypothetical protein
MKRGAPPSFGAQLKALREIAGYAFVNALVLLAARR